MEGQLVRILCRVDQVRPQQRGDHGGTRESAQAVTDLHVLCMFGVCEATGRRGKRRREQHALLGLLGAETRVSVPLQIPMGLPKVSCSFANERR